MFLKPHTILDSNLIIYRNAPCSTYLELKRKVKVTATQKQYVAHWGQKMYPHTNIWSLMSYNIECMLRTRFYTTEVRGQDQSDPKIVRYNPQHEDACIDEI